MLIHFDRFVLDPARFELREDGTPVAIEPQVLSLLLLLASNPDRLISKDEMVEKIWDGRIISEAAIASRIKAARRAIGDDGKQQRLIRTIHGRGLRFIGDVEFQRAEAAVPVAASPPSDSTLAAGDGRPSIAVLPFRITNATAVQPLIADALADELIADLSRLRWLFVIARGSSFRFRGPDVDCRRVGESLGVRYCLTGGMSFAGPAVSIAVELIDTATNGVIWAESFTDAVERIFELRTEIAARVVAALEIQIPTHEAQRARRLSGEMLDAWSAYHLGLDHMFRFNRADNAHAAAMFERAIALDPECARAFGGLSFTRFQNAFLNYQPDHDAEADAARMMAEQALRRDPLDPFCQLNMGRALWLDGNVRESIEWLDRATQLSPSYAQGVYAKAWARTLLGEADDGESDARLALQLSPLDPLRYAMLATHALANVVRGDYANGAMLAERAARSPGAHKHIEIIAAVATHLDGRKDAASQWAARAKRRDADLTARDFLRSFPFPPSATRETIERALADVGL